MQERSDLRRGDSFDIGDYLPTGHGNSDIQALISNPSKLISSLNLTSKQAENIRAVIASAGAGVSVKYLSKYFGDEIAGAVGGFLGAYIGKRIAR